MDHILRARARAYRADPSDANAHALAMAVIRSGTGAQNPPWPQEISGCLTWGAVLETLAAAPPELLQQPAITMETSEGGAVFAPLLGLNTLPHRSYSTLIFSGDPDQWLGESTAAHPDSIVAETGSLVSSNACEVCTQAILQATNTGAIGPAGSLGIHDCGHNPICWCCQLAQPEHPAIVESRETNSIVTIPWTSMDEIELLAEAQGTATSQANDGFEIIEFWGPDWRVHLRRNGLLR